MLNKRINTSVKADLLTLLFGYYMTQREVMALWLRYWSIDHEVTGLSTTATKVQLLDP